MGLCDQEWVGWLTPRLLFLLLMQLNGFLVTLARLQLPRLLKLRYRELQVIDHRIGGSIVATVTATFIATVHVMGVGIAAVGVIPGLRHVAVFKLLVAAADLPNIETITIGAKSGCVPSVVAWLWPLTAWGLGTSFQVHRTNSLTISARTCACESGAIDWRERWNGVLQW